MTEYTDDKIIYSDKDIFLGIWTSPRKIFKYINDNKYDKYTLILIVLVGISGVMENVISSDSGDFMSFLGLLGLFLILGAVAGALLMYIYAALVSWSGQFLQGKGDTNSLLRILAYANIPSVVSLILVIPQIIAYGVAIFKGEGDIFGTSIFLNIIWSIAAILQIVLGILSIVFSIIGVSEVQKVSIFQAIINLLLPSFILFVPFVLIFFFLMH